MIGMLQTILNYIINPTKKEHSARKTTKHFSDRAAKRRPRPPRPFGKVHMKKETGKNPSPDVLDLII